MLAKVLYPLDLTPLSQRGLMWVVSHVLQDNSKILVIHVVNPAIAGIDTPRYVHDAEISIDTLCKTVIPENTRTEIKVVAGDIMEILPETARTGNCTFAVIPVRNGEDVIPMVRTMAIPQLLLRQKDNVIPEKSVLSRIAIAADLSPDRTSEILEKVKDIISGSEIEPEINILHGVPLEETEESQNLVNMAEKALEKVLVSVREWNDKTEAELISGQPDEEIPKRIKELDPTILVVGLALRGEVWQLILGSTAKALIEKTECPVLVIPTS